MPYEQLHPLVFFWIAFYDDGTCLPQFDIETGKENFFKDIDQDKLQKFGLFPLSADLTSKVNDLAKAIVVRQAENLPFFILKLEKGQRLINIRRNFINFFSFYICENCGYVWQAMKGYPEGTIGDSGLPIHGDTVIDELDGKPKEVAQCPKCKTYNSLFCPDCKTRLQIGGRPSNLLPSNEVYRFCVKCQKEHPWQIKVSEDSNHLLTYIIGYQTTIDNKNVKQLMFIRENGEFILHSDL